MNNVIVRTRLALLQMQIPSSWLAIVRRYWTLVVFLLALLVNVMLYAPALNAYFTSDDFGTIHYLFFQPPLSDRFDLFWFLFQSNDGGLYFRPTGQLMYLLDALSWGIAPLGYHLTNLLFHILSAFLVYLLSWVIARRKSVALATLLIFSVVPVHAGAVSWIGARYDVICGTFYLSAVLFFALYCRKPSRRLYLLALAMFILALSSKEVAITLPAAILIYDIVANFPRSQGWGNLIKRELPFWAIVGIFLGLRLVLVGRIGYRGSEFTINDLAYWIDGALVHVLDPFITDISENSRWLLLGFGVLLLFLYRSRREVVLGLAWIPIAFIATINSGPSDRSFYVSSFGVALVLSSILLRPVDRSFRWARVIGTIVLAGLLVIFAYQLILRNQLYYRAGEVAQAIPRQVKSFYLTLPHNAELYLVGVPDQVPSGILVYLTGLTASFHLTYGTEDFQVLKVNQFPDSLDDPNRAFFFQVDHSRVYDRTQQVRESLVHR